MSSDSSPSPSPGRDDDDDDDEEEDQAAAAAAAERLYDAIVTARRLNAVQPILDKFPHLVRHRYPCENHRLPLHLAVVSGCRVEVVRHLYQRWPRALREPDDEGSVPAHLVGHWICGVDSATAAAAPATFAAPMATARFLVGRWPASLAVRNLGGELPLHTVAAAAAAPNAATAALCNLAANIVRFLVRQRPSSVREVDDGGRLPLHAALGNRHLPMVRNPHEWVSYSRISASPLAIRPPRYSLEVVRLLVEQFPSSPRHRDGSGNLPLHTFLAESSGASEEIVRYLVELHPRAVRVRDGSGNTPLHLAIHRVPSRSSASFFWNLGHRVSYFLDWRDVVCYLAAQDRTALRQRDRRGRLPLHAAVSHSSDPDLLRWLVDHDPRAVRDRDKDGCLPLHAAVAASELPSADVVDLLLGLWPDSVHVPDEIGRTALHLAAAARREQIDRLLVAASPGPLRSRDGQGRLPLHTALTRKDPPLELVRFLIQEHPRSLLVPDRQGRLPLHVALSAKKVAPPNVVRLLVESAPEAAERRDSTGLLPLHVLVARSDPPPTVQTVLLLVGACPPAVEAPDGMGRTPLHAELSRDRPSWNLVTALVEAWPPAVQAPDASGRTPLLLAAADAKTPLRVLYMMVRQRPEACCCCRRVAAAEPAE